GELPAVLGQQRGRPEPVRLVLGLGGEGGDEEQVVGPDRLLGVLDGLGHRDGLEPDGEAARVDVLALPADVGERGLVLVVGHVQGLHADRRAQQDDADGRVEQPRLASPAGSAPRGGGGHAGSSGLTGSVTLALTLGRNLLSTFSVPGCQRMVGSGKPGSSSNAPTSSTIFLGGCSPGSSRKRITTLEVIPGWSWLVWPSLASAKANGPFPSLIGGVILRREPAKASPTMLGLLGGKPTSLVSSLSLVTSKIISTKRLSSSQENSPFSTETFASTNFVV